MSAPATDQLAGDDGPDYYDEKDIGTDEISLEIKLDENGNETITDHYKMGQIKEPLKQSELDTGDRVLHDTSQDRQASHEKETEYSDKGDDGQKKTSDTGKKSA